MINIDIYRARIGCFHQPMSRKFRTFTRANKSSSSGLLTISLCFLIYSLIFQVLFCDVSQKCKDSFCRNKSIFSGHALSTVPNMSYESIQTIGHGLYLSPNFYAKYTYGNRNQNGIKIAHFNKGPAFLKNRIHEIESIIQDHKPHILGLSEANFFSNHDKNEVKLQDYELFTSLTLTNPEILASRVVVYKHVSIISKLRTDLMNDTFSSI